MKRGLFVVLFLLWTSAAFAQASAASKIMWDQTAADLTTAQSLLYKHYDDAIPAGVALTPVVCTAAPPATPTLFPCSAPFPAFTPGTTHTIALTAGNLAGESLKSTPLSFTFIVIPSPPQNLRIVKGNWGMGFLKRVVGLV
jgi:hypothetical protein